MRRPAPALAVALAALTLAGCLGAAPPAGLEPGTAAQAPLRVVEGACREQETAYVVPVAAARDLGLYPEGFAPWTLDPAGGLTALAYVGFACGTLALDGAPPAHDEHAWLGSFLLAEPPAALAREGAMHVLLQGAVLGHEGLRAALRAWGVPGVLQGDVALAFDPLPHHEQGTLAASTPGGGAITVASLVQGPGVPRDALPLRVFSADPATGALAAILDVDKAPVLAAEGAAAATFEGELASPLLAAAEAAPVATHYWGPAFTMAFTPVPLPTEAAP